MSGSVLTSICYEISENRNFRRAAWDDVTLPSGDIVSSQPPTYIDCHYLISAWSQVEDSELASPVLDEHQSLAEALRILLRNPDVVPGALGVIGGGPVFQEAHVYLTVAPPEPPRVLNDFWSTMKLPWRPAIMFVVTAPLDVLRDGDPSPPLTTLIRRFTLIGTPTIEEEIMIGGLVVNAADQSPIAGATVTRLANNQTATTDFARPLRFHGSAARRPDLSRGCDGHDAGGARYRRCSRPTGQARHPVIPLKKA